MTKKTKTQTKKETEESKVPKEAMIVFSKDEADLMMAMLGKIGIGAPEVLQQVGKSAMMKIMDAFGASSPSAPGL